MRLTWKEFKYKNLSLILLGLVIAFFISRLEPFRLLLLQLQSESYVGAILGGVLFVSTFTFGIGAIILVAVAEHSNLLAVAVLAGLGAVLGDLLIFSLVKDRLLGEITYLYHKLDGNPIQKIFYSHLFAWMLPILGAIIIASPLPDELGVGLMGLSNMSTFKFALVSFVLNTIGILLILVGYQTLR